MEDTDVQRAREFTLWAWGRAAWRDNGTLGSDKDGVSSDSELEDDIIEL